MTLPHSKERHFFLELLRNGFAFSKDCVEKAFYSALIIKILGLPWFGLLRFDIGYFLISTRLYAYFHEGSLLDYYSMTLYYKDGPYEWECSQHISYLTLSFLAPTALFLRVLPPEIVYAVLIPISAILGALCCLCLIDTFVNAECWSLRFTHHPHKLIGVRAIRFVEPISVQPIPAFVPEETFDTDESSSDDSSEEDSSSNKEEDSSDEECDCSDPLPLS